MQSSNKKIYVGSRSSSPLGILWAAVSAAGVCAVDFGVDEVVFLRRVMRLRAVELVPDEGAAGPVLDQMQAYLNGQRQEFDIDIDWEGVAPFTRRAREAVIQIPYGETRAYGEVAAELGRPGASRAVGRANATNPSPLVIPCHRVVAADGALQGYGGTGGTKTKQWLLDLERRHAEKGQMIMPGMAD